jgi:excisionase family DNA binding protein
MAGHRLDRRRIKRHHSYTVDEAARAIGAARGTVRRWLDKGLPAIRDRKPFLILGDDLAAYMAARSVRNNPARPAPAIASNVARRGGRPATWQNSCPLTPIPATFARCARIAAA